MAEEQQEQGACESPVHVEASEYGKWDPIKSTVKYTKGLPPHMPNGNGEGTGELPILFLHGRGCNPQRDPVLQHLQAALPHRQIVAPYYQNNDMENLTDDTLASLNLLHDVLIGRDMPEFGSERAEPYDGAWDVVGYSYGGLVAGLLASENPHLVGADGQIRKLVLVAPAIDQERRNGDAEKNPYYAGLAKAGPEALARPKLANPSATMVVHGTWDNDKRGCDPKEIAKFVEEQGIATYITPKVDHSMYPNIDMAQFMLSQWHKENWLDELAGFLGPH